MRGALNPGIKFVQETKEQLKRFKAHAAFSLVWEWQKDKHRVKGDSLINLEERRGGQGLRSRC